MFLVINRRNYFRFILSYPHFLKAKTLWINGILSAIRLTLLDSEQPKCCGVLPILSAIGLMILTGIGHLHVGQTMF